VNILFHTEFLSILLLLKWSDCWWYCC